MGVKIVLFLLCAGALLAQQAPEKPGDFTIRFEPAAKLQTGVEVPFTITVIDDLHKPVIDAKVTLQISTTDGTQAKVFKAPQIGRIASPGVYTAKPIFPFAGEWNVYVEVHLENHMSARTIQFSVPQ